MGWDYAELSKMAKANGGPEKLVNSLVKSGKIKMMPWVGAALVGGVMATLGIQKTIKYLTDKKEKSNAEFEIAKQELIQGIKDYDRSQDLLEAECTDLSNEDIHADEYVE